MGRCPPPRSGTRGALGSAHAPTNCLVLAELGAPVAVLAPGHACPHLLVGLVPLLVPLVSCSHLSPAQRRVLVPRTLLSSFPAPTGPSPGPSCLTSCARLSLSSCPAAPSSWASFSPSPSTRPSLRIPLVPSAAAVLLLSCFSLSLVPLVPLVPSLGHTCPQLLVSFVSLFGPRRSPGTVCPVSSSCSSPPPCPPRPLSSAASSPLPVPPGPSPALLSGAAAAALAQTPGDSVQPFGARASPSAAPHLHHQMLHCDFGPALS